MQAEQTPIPIDQQGNFIIPAIQSDNYVAGVSGWKILASGTAEFNDITAHGNEIIVGPSTAEQVKIFATSGIAGAEFKLNTTWEDGPASIGSNIVPWGASNFYAAFDFQSLVGFTPNEQSSVISLESESTDGTRPAQIRFWTRNPAADTLAVITPSVATFDVPIVATKTFQRGSTSHAFSANTFVDVNVTFSPAFTAKPYVTATLAWTGALPAGSSDLGVRVYNLTSTGMTVRVLDHGAVARTLTATVDWHAEL